MLPIEWLNGLVERRDGYRRLVDDSGDLSVAAWRFARAKCQVREVPTEVPTRVELHAAARVIARRARLGESVPARAVLASRCEARGLLVM